MSSPNKDSDADEERGSPLLFEDSQNSIGNVSMEVLGKSTNDSKETNVSKELAGQSLDRDSDFTESPCPMSPQRPVHNLFGSQQSYLSTSSPLRYPNQSFLSLSRSIKSSQTRLQIIEEDSPNLSLTPMDDVVSFGSISGVSDQGTPIENKGSKRKADLSCSDSDVEVICEKNNNSSQEEHVNKKARQSVEFLRYASTPQRAPKAPSFQASDVSDEAIQIKPIPEESDTVDDLVNLHYSPSQDVDVHTEKFTATCKNPVAGVKKLKMTSQDESPDSGSTSTDSNSIFAQVNKVAAGVSVKSSSDSSVEVTAIQAKEEDYNEDTFPVVYSSDEPLAETSAQKQNKIEESDAKQKVPEEREGYIYTKIMYTVSNDGKSMENIRIVWQLPVCPEVLSDTSSSLRSMKSLSPSSGQNSDSQLHPLQPEPVLKCLRSSLSSSGSSSSGGSMLPPRFPRIPQEAFKILHKPMMLKKDSRFCAEGILQLIPTQIESKPSPLATLDGNKDEIQAFSESITEKVEEQESVKSKVQKTVKSKTLQRGRRKGSSSKKSASKASVSSNGTTPVAQKRMVQRKRKLNVTSGQVSPEPVHDVADQMFSPARESSKVAKSESEIDFELDRNPAIKSGQSVFAKWSDDLYYPGIVGVLINGKWDIRFDDGGRKQVLEEHIIPTDKLPVGQPVYATYQSNELNFYPGIIYSHIESPQGVMYQVDLDKEGQHDVPRSQLCMNQEQVNILKGDIPHNYSLSTPTQRHDVSLDNMMDGKRSRSKRQISMDNGVSNKKPAGRTRAAASTEPKPGCSHSSSYLVTLAEKLDAVEASSESQTDTQIVWKSDWDNIPGVEEVEWPALPIKFEKSKSKNNTDKEKVLGPIPQKKIFKDFIFCLCYTPGQGSESQSEFSGRESELESQDADSDKDDALPFDRMHLRQQLTKGGGTVVEFFEEHHVKRAADKCLMITNRCNTSAKSILCLALGVRSVRFSWVIQCCIENKLLSHKSYLLPAGQSLNPRGKVEWYNRPDNIRPFIKFKVALVSSVGEEFLEFWKKVFIFGKANQVLTFLIEKFLNQEKELVGKQIDIIVTDNEHTEDLMRMANELKLPLVRTSWAVQSLVCGTCVSPILHQINNLDRQHLSDVIQSISYSQ